jgi:hypothetical protein
VLTLFVSGMPPFFRDAYLHPTRLPKSEEKVGEILRSIGNGSWPKYLSFYLVGREIRDC